MRICLLIHGVEAFYSGSISKLIENLKPFGEIEAFVTGTMARTASLDVDFEVKIWDGTPSELFKEMEKDFDLFLILSCSKSPESGYEFGRIVFERCAIKKPLIQLELSNCTAVLWNGFCSIAEGLGFEIVEPKSLEKRIWIENGKLYRRISAVEPGEFLLIGGIVVGKVKEKEVLLIAENGKLVELKGVEVKEHGLEKLKRFYPTIELEKIKICTLRSFKSKETALKGKKGSGVAFIDHSSDKIFKFAGKCEGAVCIGDDTTAIASEILFRFDTPVLGIVDGDRDFLLDLKNIHPSSEILITEHDDLAGKIVFEELFKGKEILMENFEEVKDRIVELLRLKHMLSSRKALKDFSSDQEILL
ncbi:MAG: DUF2117 domain-containing protein [Archaeoglobaceae archaeon]|nr:DUF2117 domain-containing protein [Archaeoglobaceae archaeon]MDW8128386.1 DUF2117 domain-containing protein [Archaeoglobaceae archaeon]